MRLATASLNPEIAQDASEDQEVDFDVERMRQCVKKYIENRRVDMNRWSGNGRLVALQELETFNADPARLMSDHSLARFENVPIFLSNKIEAVDKRFKVVRKMRKTLLKKYLVKTKEWLKNLFQSQIN